MVCHALTIVDADSKRRSFLSKRPSICCDYYQEISAQAIWVLVIVFQHRFNGPGNSRQVAYLLTLLIQDSLNQNIFIPEAGLIFTSANLSGSRR